MGAAIYAQNMSLAMSIEIAIFYNCLAYEAMNDHDMNSLFTSDECTLHLNISVHVISWYNPV